jgi:hypothetical protein
MDTVSQKSPENNFLAFAKFFKGYMGVMPLIAAAVAPLLTATKVIPTFASQKGPLATVAGVLGFLLVALVFYVRRTIALGSMKPRTRTLFNFLPIIFFLATILCFVFYSRTIDESVAEVQKTDPTLSRTDVLETWSKEHAVPNSLELELYFMGSFLFPVGAFAMMALREYAKDGLGISERDWMFGDQPGSPGWNPSNKA